MPKTVKRYEGHLSGFDQTELFFQTWTPDVVRGVFLITHGLGEHSESYHPLAEALAERGWQVYAWDLRGHGKSDGKRGYVRHVDDFVSDLSLVHRLARERHASHQLVLFGHSLGGLITLRYAETKAPDYAAMALSSPALGLTVAVPAMKQLLAQVARKWLPTLTMSNEIRHEDLSRDPAMLAKYASDNLRHDKVSPGLFLSMVDSFPPALADAAKVTKPVLMQVAGSDRIVDAEAARTVFAKLPNAENKIFVYPDSMHEVFNDLDRDGAIEQLNEFLAPYLGAN